MNILEVIVASAKIEKRQILFIASAAFPVICETKTEKMIRNSIKLVGK